MTARSQIPETQGVSDQKTRDILTSMRTIINNLTGRNGGTIQTLSASADLGGVINKINEILAQIQDTPNTQSNIPVSSTSGIWTPIDSSGANLTLNVYGANYFRIGRLVLIIAYIIYPVTANGSQAVIGGLPFLCTKDLVFPQILIRSDATFSGSIIGQINPSTKTLTPLLSSASAAVLNSTLSQHTFTLNGFYYTD